MSPNNALTTEFTPTTTVKTSMGARYPCAIRNPMPCTLPRPIARTSIGKAMAVVAEMENEISGAPIVGSAHGIGTLAVPM
jgi:hypothetical protein